MGSITERNNGLEFDNMTQSPEGSDWLLDNPKFFEIIGKFCALSILPESAIENLEFVAKGNSSIVRKIGGLAIKVSSTTTIRNEQYNPEDLVSQFIFLSALSDYFHKHPNLNLTVPDQMFVLKSRGSYLKAERLMEGWTTLFEASKLNGRYEKDHANEINNRVKNRINNSGVPYHLMLGLNDLGLKKSRYFSSRNILVPLGEFDPNQSPLCIIDQPGNRKKFSRKNILNLRSE